MPDDRRALHAYMSDAAHEAWHSFAADNGASVSGLLEAIGQNINEAMESGTEPAPFDAGLIKSARRIDAGRRRRGSGTASATR
jgi:hypothetical protein